MRKDITAVLLVFIIFALALWARKLDKDQKAIDLENYCIESIHPECIE
jgi:hypothetical protein